MSGSSSGTLGTSAKGIRRLVILSTKGKLHDSSFGGSRDTPVNYKRKLGSLFMISGDLIEGEFDPVANKKISYVTDSFLHTSECISMNMAAEADILDLNERYSQVFKACYDVSASHPSSSYPPYFFSHFFCCRRLSTLAIVFETLAVPRLHKRRLRN